LFVDPPRADVIVALVLTVLAVVEGSTRGWGDPAAFGPATLVMTVALAWRRRQPLLVFIMVVGAAVSGWAAPFVGITAIMVAAYSVGAYHPRRIFSLGVMFATATVVVTVYHGRLPPTPDVLGPYVVLIPLSSAALLAVESSGREAMTELRHLLGLLSQDDEGVALTPQPGVGQLDSLVRRVGEAGLPATRSVAGQPRLLPAGIDLTVYRIVQEALTNALKYADLTRTDVILDYRESELKVEILDEGPGRVAREGEGTGHGLVGMRERVALYGGTLEAGPRLERGYAVRAWLPLPACD